MMGSESSDGQDYTEAMIACMNSHDIFPMKLHKMLEEAEHDGNDGIVSWNPDGLSFTVHEPKVFARGIMQTYFNQTKYKSFQRQLNLYRFVRERRGKKTGVCEFC